MTLIDTPAISHPCFHLNELAIQEVQNADAIVLVVNPTSALTTFDSKALQILQRIPSERIVVYVNQLEHIGKDHLKPLVDHASALIRRQLGDGIPILAGNLGPSILGAPNRS